MSLVAVPGLPWRVWHYRRGHLDSNSQSRGIYAIQHLLSQSGVFSCVPESLQPSERWRRLCNLIARQGSGHLRVDVLMGGPGVLSLLPSRPRFVSVSDLSHSGLQGRQALFAELVTISAFGYACRVKRLRTSKCTRLMFEWRRHTVANRDPPRYRDGQSGRTTNMTDPELLAWRPKPQYDPWLRSLALRGRFYWIMGPIGLFSFV